MFIKKIMQMQLDFQRDIEWAVVSVCLTTSPWNLNVIGVSLNKNEEHSNKSSQNFILNWAQKSWITIWLISREINNYLPGLIGRWYGPG